MSNSVADRRGVIACSVASAGRHMSASPRRRFQQASLLAALSGRPARFRIDKMQPSTRKAADAYKDIFAGCSRLVVVRS
jgi:hypothetical protein